MKAIVTIIFILFIGFTAHAQEKTAEVKVETIKTEIVTDIKVEDNAVARLYRRSNSRVKKALNFTTKRNKAKMA